MGAGGACNIPRVFVSDRRTGWRRPASPRVARMRVRGGSGALRRTRREGDYPSPPRKTSQRQGKHRAHRAILITRRRKSNTRRTSTSFYSGRRAASRTGPGACSKECRRGGGSAGQVGHPDGTVLARPRQDCPGVQDIARRAAAQRACPWDWRVTPRARHIRHHRGAEPTPLTRSHTRCARWPLGRGKKRKEEGVLDRNNATFPPSSPRGSRRQQGARASERRVCE